MKIAPYSLHFAHKANYMEINMSLKYMAITANCGNDTLGSKASETIKSQFKTDNLDFCVINCQETDFNKTKNELQKAFGPDYTIMRAGEMVTRTKTDLNVLSGNTGMVSFVVCKPGVNVELDSTLEARRDATKYYGTALNKGGVISHCTVSQGNESVRLQLVSGHLDSNKTMERAKDWQVIQHNIAESSDNMKTFSDLINIIPDIRISGYDANTRNKVVGNDVVNMWEDNAYELEGLKQMPLGSGRFSAESTYKSNKTGIETEFAEGKRLGFTKGGMLDFVDVLDGAPANGIIQRVNVIHPDDPSTKRDHAVVMGPAMYSLTYNSDFDQVKNYMASMLENAAPEFAKDLRNLPENGRNKSILVDIYREFLSKEGLLNKELQLFTSKLNTIKKASKSGEDAELLAKDTLFNDDKPWFADVRISNYMAQVEMIGLRQNTTLENIARIDSWNKNDNSSVNSSSISSDSMESRSISSLSISSDSSSSKPNKWASLRSSHDSESEQEKILSTSPSKDISAVFKSNFKTMKGLYQTLTRQETPTEELKSSFSPGNKGS